LKPQDLVQHSKVFAGPLLLPICARDGVLRIPCHVVTAPYDQRSGDVPMKTRWRVKTFKAQQ
jgi:hypothetical protein